MGGLWGAAGPLRSRAERASGGVGLHACNLGELRGGAERGLGPGHMGVVWPQGCGETCGMLHREAVGPGLGAAPLSLPVSQEIVHVTPA